MYIAIRWPSFFNEMVTRSHRSSIGFQILLVLSWITVLSTTVASQDSSASDDSLKKQATWNWPDLRIASEQWKSYLDLLGTTEELRDRVELVWKANGEEIQGPQVLEQMLSAAALVDSRIAGVLVQMESMRDHKGYEAIDLSWFDSKVPGWLQDNLKLAVARSLAQGSFYDESLEYLESLTVSSVIDPSSLFFYKAVCYHHLLQKAKCLEQIDALLERENEIASRYMVTAKLMKSDLQSLEPESLDEIARLMTDVERRLELGRAGTKVRTQEKEIVDKLDKMIDKIEQQLEKQKQQKNSKSKSDKKNAQRKPMEESRIAGENGPGDVDPKKLQKEDTWGNLPPAQRQESLQNITRDLPSHYREVIEAYFKKLGTGEKQ